MYVVNNSFIHFLIAVLVIGRIAESVCIDRSQTTANDVTSSSPAADEASTESAPAGDANQVVTAIIQRKTTAGSDAETTTQTPVSSENNKIETEQKKIETTQPIVITTTTEVTISPLDQCVFYSAAKYKTAQAKAGLLISQIIPTSNDNSVPCCRACNLQPQCAMFTYAINNQNNAVCNLYSLPSSLVSYNAYFPFLVRTFTNTYVGFTYDFIRF
jgi:hypothetical protein